jgi:hypothetical protein
LVVVEAAERAAASAVLEDPDFEIADLDGPIRSGERSNGVLQRERQAFECVFGGGETGLDRLSVSAQDREARLVGDRALVGDAVELRGARRVAQLCDENLDLERLLALREHVAEVLGVVVRQGPDVDVTTRVGETGRIGPADARLSETVELVVLAHAGEGDAVVDLRDLEERR